MIMKWIKIAPEHRPVIGQSLFSGHAPDSAGGTLYFVVDRDERGFTVESGPALGNASHVSERQRLYIPYELLPVTNFHIWDHAADHS
jgi:hypothetical protein